MNVSGGPLSQLLQEVNCKDSVEHECPDQIPQNELQTKTFDPLSAEDVCVDLGLIPDVKACSLEVLCEEALFFLIMAQNYGGFVRHLDYKYEFVSGAQHALADTHAICNATSYLDGSQTCAIYPIGSASVQ
jgi:hypothetical protein